MPAPRDSLSCASANRKEAPLLPRPRRPERAEGRGFKVRTSLKSASARCSGSNSLARWLGTLETAGAGQAPIQSQRPTTGRSSGRTAGRTEGQRRFPWTAGCRGSNPTSAHSWISDCCLNMKCAILEPEFFLISPIPCCNCRMPWHDCRSPTRSTSRPSRPSNGRPDPRVVESGAGGSCETAAWWTCRSRSGAERICVVLHYAKTRVTWRHCADIRSGSVRSRPGW